MKNDRHDIEAGRNVLNMLKQVSPGDHARLMAQLKANAGMNGALGAATTEEQTPGFWDRLFEAGAGALTTIADYKIQEEQAKQQQEQYQDAVAVEMERQALLAAQKQSQALEYQNQMEFQRQRQELEAAATRSKGTLNTALIGVGALVGLWILYRAIA